MSPAPDPILAKVLQAEQMLARGDAAGALAIAQRLLPKGPRDPGLNSLMSLCFLRKGAYEQAEFYARRALEAAPGESSLLVNLATIHQARGRDAEALALLRQALAASPTDAKARLSLANAMMDAHDAPGAAALLREGLAIAPDAQLSISYAGALLTMGRIEDSIAATREGLRHHPDEVPLVAGLPNAMTYLWGVHPDDLAEAHFAYGRLLERVRPVPVYTHAGQRDRAKRLRVGIVSPDLRQHSVAFFIEPFFQHHDRAQFELVAYSSTRHPDATTARLKASTVLWRETPNLNDLQLAKQIHDDRIDIAIDLAGHTLGNNLPAFSLRPAPVQVTYCGYPDTTGLRQIDYRIVDSHTDPPTPEVDRRASEKLWRLDPCFLCYRPPAEAPAPAREPGPITFGSFNASRKINRPLIALWARLLRAVPASRLMLKSFDFASPAVAQRIRDGFVDEQIDLARIDFLAATKSLADHLALYARMDVALDAFPYCGTTTTCEALWMGVPVVSLAGNTHAGRVGVSLLSAVGAPELIAQSESEYVALAGGLAQDPPRLATYRAALREQLKKSPVLDAPGFARRFGDALRAMWAM